MQVVKAVVLAGDCRGSAPWPSLGLAARQLVPVANRPVLFHHLDALTHAGVQEAAIVTDATTQASIRHALGDGSEWGLGLIHLQHDGSENVLASGAVSDFVGSAPVLVHHGDILLRERLSALEVDVAAQDLDALILRPHALRALGETAAGYIIGSNICPPLRGQAASLDAVLERLQAAGARIGVREVDACLPCRGSTDALLDTNRCMLEAMPADQHGERVFGSEIQGRVALDPSAEIHDSVIRGPVAIGPRARVANAYIGPYTSIGADVQIECAEVEHSIVLDRAKLRFVGTRIGGSLIGPDACITRDFRMPQAIRLSVGAGAQVAIS